VSERSDAHRARRAAPAWWARPGTRALATVALLLAWAGPALAEHPTEPYAQALQQLRQSPTAPERAWAALGLGHGFRMPWGLLPETIVAALHQAMETDPDATVRAAAGYGLCVRRDPRGVPRLIDTLRAELRSGRDPRGPLSDAVRLPARNLYYALATCGDPAGPAFLLEMATTGPQPGRIVAIAALSLVPNPPGEIERTLTALATDGDPDIRQIAERAITERARRKATP
jgi:HEAT repeat protein